MQPEFGTPQAERAECQQNREDDEGYRDAKNVVLAEHEKILVGDDGGLQVLHVGAVQRETGTAKHVERGEGNDEGGDAKPGYEQAVDGSGDAADRQCNRDGDRRLHFVQPDQVV